MEPEQDQLDKPVQTQTFLPQNGEVVQPPVQEKTEPKKSRTIIIVVLSILVILSGVFAVYFLTNKTESTNQSTVSYQRPPSPAGWTESSIVFNNVTFLYAHPSEWTVGEQYNEPSGLYSDVRIETDDYVEVSSTQEYAKKGVVEQGAAFEIMVQKYQGDLASYEKGLKNKTIGDGGMLLQGYRGLEQTTFGNRNALTYLKNANFVRQVVIVDGGYAAVFSYFQPYSTTDVKTLPDLQDTHRQQFNDIVSSFGYPR